MWEHAGVVREASDMEQAIGMLDEVRSALPSVDVRPSEEGWGDLAHVLDLQAMLGTAEATLRGAMAREETRGAHLRSDFPELDPEMAVNFIVGRGSDAHMTLERARVPAVSEDLTSWLEPARDVDSAGKLLE
jgi:succinate dehydrogenase / fumarate reductase flavoprotein subunit